jgi:iron(II)-dependent oxidoreductase
MPAIIPSAEARDVLLARMAAARRQTDKLFELVRPGSLYDRPIAERHRIIFYRGHLEAFDWNLLQPRLPKAQVFDRGLDQLFAFGIDPVDGALPSDFPSDWPVQPHVERYVSRIRAGLDAILPNLEFSDWAGEETPDQLLHVAIEHRLMHAETLAYMLHQLPIEKKIPESQTPVVASNPLVAGMVEIPEGCSTLGLPRQGSLFGWDNEYEAHTVHAPAFLADRYKVTNRDYLEFVRAGAYQQSSLWTPEDWKWITQQQITHPVFWKRAGDRFLYRGMFAETSLPLEWPVYVSHAEASAYARWIGKRLPTEAEWQRACYGTREVRERQFPWGSDRPAGDHGYFAFERWDPCPVNAFPRAASSFGVEGMLANGWEWTSSVFQPFPGFRPFPFYEGYSANFFDGRHYVIKGGSTRTDASMLRRSFRNWFQPHYQYVYAGFRCASD